MRILNLYAGIGGNRKLWQGHEVTAVEYREDIAAVYKHYFPQDQVIIADAHKYLLDHYEEYDIIGSSIPCPTHSRANFWGSKTATNRKKYYPDMSLYQEIIFLKNWFGGKWWVENVVPYYSDILIPYTKRKGRHLFWSNFHISDFDVTQADIKDGDSEEWIKVHGFDLSQFKIHNKTQVYRNCIHPETGLHILNCALKKELKQTELFV